MSFPFSDLIRIVNTSLTIAVSIIPDNYHSIPTFVSNRPFVPFTLVTV